MDTTILIHESGPAVVNSRMMKLSEAESGSATKDVTVSGKQIAESTPGRGADGAQRPAGSGRRLWVIGLLFCAAVGLLIAVGSGLMDRRPAEFQSPTTGAIPSNYNPDRAMGYLVQLCDLGPRPSGTAAMQRQQQLLQKLFQRTGGDCFVSNIRGASPRGRVARADGEPDRDLASRSSETVFDLHALRHTTLPRSRSPQSPWCVCGCQRWRQRIGGLG